MNIKRHIPKFVFRCWHFSLAFLGAFIYGFPSKKMKVIGITGTNGKSTTATICFNILKEAGHRVASVSSISFKIGEKEETNDLKMTMPGRMKIQKFLKDALKEKCEYVIVEVTSEGIRQFRHKFIDFDIAIFTNLSKEHIESHGSFENYRAAKGEFFNQVKGVHILNKDDLQFEYFNSFNARKKITYSMDNPSDVQADDVCVSHEGSKFKILGEEFKTKLLGKFNVYNCLAAIAFAQNEGIYKEHIKEGILKTEGVRGRMEKVIYEPFSFYIDYAFTPSALEQVYQYLKPDIAILGACGGGRDRWKRPILGALAEKYAKTVIVTNEDPYDEDPEKIIDEVLAGAPNGIKILDRREAIRRALEMAKPGDVIISTGKGSETCIACKRGKREKWDEREVILEEFKKLNK